ncbi:hypothetical protein N9544_01375 [Flavobacteriales bacterium]|nr:hypothetical protein [Flavobacteriales bacterium]
MKKVTLTIMLILSIITSITYSNDSIELDTVQTEKVVDSTSVDVQENQESSDLKKQNASENAEWFMYGFLVLGAFLVFWKFKNNK